MVQPIPKKLSVHVRKKCNGLHGLKAHQRSCRRIKTLCNEVLDDLNSNNRADQHASKNARIYAHTSPQFVQKFGKQIIFRHLGREQSVY